MPGLKRCETEGDIRDAVEVVQDCTLEIGRGLATEGETGCGEARVL